DTLWVTSSGDAAIRVATAVSGSMATQPLADVKVLTTGYGLDERQAQRCGAPCTDRVSVLVPAVAYADPSRAQISPATIRTITAGDHRPQGWSLVYGVGNGGSFVEAPPEIQIAEEATTLGW